MKLFKSFGQIGKIKDIICKLYLYQGSNRHKNSIPDFRESGRLDLYRLKS